MCIKLLQKHPISVIIKPMAPERLHPVEHTEVNPATNALEGAYAHQAYTSEQRKRPFGDFLRKAAWALGLSTAAVIVGDTIKSTQSQSTTSSIDTVYPAPVHYSTTTSGGGWLNGLGTVLGDVGLIGLAATAAILGVELFRNHKQNKRKKVNVIY